MFAISTNAEAPKATPRQYDGNIDFAGHADRAIRKAKQIITQIESCETAQDVKDALTEHELVIDAIHLGNPELSEQISEAADTQKSILSHGTEPAVNAVAPAPIPAIAQCEIETSKGSKTMFATNSTEGTLGPWVTWTSNGSAQKGFAPKSWVLRDKDDHGNKVETVIAAFAEPCVFDVDSLQLGWEKDGAAGQAPERKYSSHFSVPMPRPDDSKKPSGAYAWSNCLQVRIALSQEKAATWEQGSFGAYKAFEGLAKQIEAQWDQSQNGTLLPVVQQTGVEEKQLKSGTSNTPILSIVKWVPRPAVLTDDAPAIATNATPETPAPAAVAAQQPVATGAPAGGQF